MNQSWQEVLLKILDAIEYNKDKEVFTQQFFDLIDRQTRNDLILSLPQDKQKNIIDELSQEKDIERIKLIFNRYFTESQISQTLEKATQETFQEYIKSILPSLTETQKQKLQELITNLSKQSEVSSAS